MLNGGKRRDEGGRRWDEVSSGNEGSDDGGELRDEPRLTQEV